MDAATQQEAFTGTESVQDSQDSSETEQDARKGTAQESNLLSGRNEVQDKGKTDGESPVDEKDAFITQELDSGQHDTSHSATPEKISWIECACAKTK